MGLFEDIENPANLPSLNKGTREGASENTNNYLGLIHCVGLCTVLFFFITVFLHYSDFRYK